MLSEVFYTFLITSVIGMILAIFRMIYKSKCYEFNCCCFSIKRDVEIEQEEHKFDIENGISNKNSNDKIDI